jgi:hypothetical protein
MLWESFQRRVHHMSCLLRKPRLVFRAATLWLVAALLTPLCFGTALAGDRIALVIGNGEYDRSVKIDQQPNLPNARNDGDAVAKALQDLGFDVLHATDCNVEQF